MDLSGRLGHALERIHAAGLKRTAAGVADLVYRDRSFAIDADGDWVNRQAACTFVSPTPFAQRYGYVRDKIVDEWLFDYRLRPEDVVFDVGAGLGEEAVVFADMAARVYSVEAHPDTFRCLRKTVAQSGRSNVVPLQLALADRDGELRISSGDSHLANSVIEGGSGRVTVPAKSLESLCRELGVGRIDFLKMNIEGAERLAIRGFGAVEIRHLAISCHDFIPGPETRTRAEVEAFLREAGYEVRGRPDHPRPWTRHTLYARRA
ncbi:FkbM family methyltransferase [uncultured Sphingomonas sp.]|uniref:FkbM family methyltransferase n=1 Tax=uncultured Sphingomonas sp. TaxID=158754 RepID=UPI0025EAA546|nr:FkbM family methyltransferase [uncultured Sphingomonas sp.]